MVEQVFIRTQLPTPNNKIEVFSDGNDEYTAVLAEFYTESCLNYGQVIKIRERGKVVEKFKSQYLETRTYTKSKQQMLKTSTVFSAKD